jgi:hypothetical protein
MKPFFICLFWLGSVIFCSLSFARSCPSPQELSVKTIDESVQFVDRRGNKVSIPRYRFEIGPIPGTNPNTFANNVAVSDTNRIGPIRLDRIELYPTSGPHIRQISQKWEVASFYVECHYGVGEPQGERNKIHHTQRYSGGFFEFRIEPSTSRVHTGPSGGVTRLSNNWQLSKMPPDRTRDMLVCFPTPTLACLY